MYLNGRKDNEKWTLECSATFDFWRFFFCVVRNSNVFLFFFVGVIWWCFRCTPCVKCVSFRHKLINSNEREQCERSVPFFFSNRCVNMFWWDSLKKRNRCRIISKCYLFCVPKYRVKQMIATDKLYWLE